MFESLFPIKVYRDKLVGLDEAFELIKSDAEAIWAKPTALHPDLGPITFTTYNDNNALQNHPAFKNIVPQIEVMIKKCWDEYKFYKGLTPHIHEMWVNKQLKNGAVHVHNHSPYLITGVIYFNMKPGMGNLVFENPNHLVTSLQPFHWERPDEIQWNIEQVIHLEPGDIVMFPGWLRHKTEVNTTDEPRYIASFNVGVTGEYPVSSYLQQKRS
jgi:uncharacterized protein (TIGR02466 family)